ncbi:hypothetical protein BMS3Abin07_02381 [bacterium BMS3Abin07]|nr:hypothetical protein BMS3Abin07_02381 [bacterium BMS3Abin07]GBE31406.1 hypothetical protein BMS3Bbin05_00306 [bacterium BMS3Bbin05]HDL20222.1 tetratricopeptide repeat protein [Nitrospirota bacterium]HDO21439.1 tetratricopeptide repeat protein [Nitrospirota bacterium]HDZ87042.1 tetratricopeptide repeat protein [Nitrospirota bacterium]
MKKIFIAVFLLSAFLIVLFPLDSKADSALDKAVELYSHGNYEQVVGILSEYVQRDPDPSAYWLTGYSLYKLKRFDESDKYFRDAYLVDPDYSPTQIRAFMPKVEEIIRKAVEKSSSR